MFQAKIVKTRKQQLSQLRMKRNKVMRKTKKTKRRRKRNKRCVRACVCLVPENDLCFLDLLKYGKRRMTYLGGSLLYHVGRCH
mmetsp:Transcript_34823/g.52601  ORF Transcript_34823/g.52601 Transcript_34823/m.52601 type:complete len:83 (+) Transcript_34823:1206-1454(+)